MCSIAGKYSTHANYCEMDELNIRISHRGPNNSAINSWCFDNNKIFFAHNRLAIQDLDPSANQPMENERLSIVFNGEIYNHLEIRKELRGVIFKTRSDTETLLCAFREFGIEKTLSKLIGMFAIALLDKEEEKLYLIRDRLGIKPIYWTHQNGEFAFASELKGIPEYLKKQKNSKALVQFMSLGYIPAEHSIYENVFKLQAGHILIFDGNRVETKRYWKLPEEKIKINYEDAVNKTEELIESSVNYRLLSDLEVGSFLSGGIDSSLVSAIMQKNSANRIKTFSIGFEDKIYDESGYARDVAKHIGSDHYEHIFNAKDILPLLENFDYYFDEPFGDASALPMMLLSKMTKEHVTVALSGDGGDELFLGYDRYFFVDKYFKILSAIPMFPRKLISKVCRYSHVDKLEKMSYPILEPTIENLYSVISTSIKPWEQRSIFNRDFLRESIGYLELQGLRFEGRDTIDMLSSMDIIRYLPDDILTKVDRASMAYSLEARVPLLDHRIVEFAYSLTTDVRLKNGPKSILKDILYKYVPKDLVERPKRGFSVPLKEWFRGELKDILYSKIDSLDEGIFDKKYILHLANLHINHNRNYEYVFWNLMRL